MILKVYARWNYFVKCFKIWNVGRRQYRIWNHTIPNRDRYCQKLYYLCETNITCILHHDEDVTVAVATPMS